MRKIMLAAGLVATAAAAAPTSVQGFAYGFAPISGKKLVVNFNDGARCALNVSVARSGSTAKSSSRYFCSHPQGKEVRLNKIRMVNTAGIWLSGRESQRQFRTCTSNACSAPDATLSNVAANQNPTGTAIFHIYYRRNISFLLTPPNCEYVKDPEGKGPPGYRVTCAIQAR